MIIDHIFFAMLQRRGATEEEQVENSLSNFRIIQDYLTEHHGEFSIVPANMSAASETLEFMHRTVLQYMQVIYDQSSSFL